MLSRISTVTLFCTLLLAGIMVSCSGSGNPTVPDNIDMSGNNSFSGGSVPGIEPGTAFDITDDPVYHSIVNDTENYAPGEVLVVLKDGVIPEDMDGRPIETSVNTGIDLLLQHGVSVREILPLGWGTVYRLSNQDGSTVMQKVDQLKALPEVEIAEPNYKVYFCDAPYTPNDFFWENPNDDDTDPRSNVFEQFGPSKIGASVVWPDEKGSSDVVVCVLDTGVQWWHEDLFNSMWVNPGEIPDNGMDDDDNGFIDDIYGWDTNGDDPDITEYNNNFSYHGTACSGVIAATQDNTVGCSGIAPGVRIMGVKCDLGGGGGYTSSVIEGIEYAKDNGAHIVSMSFRTYSDSETMHATMDDAYANGVILVGGAGNEDATQLTYPASWSCVVEVGGTSPFRQYPSYAPTDEIRISVANGFGWGSNWGPHLEVMAFGEHYITCYGSHYSAYWDGVDNFFFGGTSNATPMVAGAFALLKSYYPAESHEWLRERIRETADDLYGPGFDNNSGYGRINLVRACYGTDRYADEEDTDGFVNLGFHNGLIFDSLNDKSAGDYIDTEDLYKIYAPETGILLVDLDIFTWGEDLDLEIYSDPSMVPEFLLDQQTGENHAGTSREGAGVDCIAGIPYYIRVFTGGLGDSTAYGLNVRTVENSVDITDSGSFDPGFIHNGANGVKIGYVDIDTTFRVHINQVAGHISGPMPVSYVSGMHLYQDTNGNKSLDGADSLVGNATMALTNRFLFEGINSIVNYDAAPSRFFFTVDLSGITEDSWFRFELTDYKSISTSEGLEVPFTKFPIVFDEIYVGVDEEAPYWPSTTGVQEVEGKYEGALLRWNSAVDILTPPVKYNVYWTQVLPFDFDTANHADNVSFWNGGSYDHAWQINNLINDQTYFVAVRAEDQAGNEDTNTGYLEVTPSAISDPTAPQVIGSVNTYDAWEVVVDPPNQRVFVADSNAGVLVIDVSDPTAPAIVDQVAANGVYGVDFDGTYVYAAGAAGLHIIDPDAAGGATTLSLSSWSDALDVCIVGNFAYLTDFDNHLVPFDVSDPAAPIQHPSVGSGYYGYGMDAQDGYLYVATYYKPRVFSLADPAAPAHLVTFGGNGAYECDAVGDRLYVTYWQGNRFAIYSLSNPADPAWIGGLTSNSGSGGSDLVLHNGYIYFGTNNHYIEVINVDNPNNLFEIGQVSTNGPDGMATDGAFIYSAENEHGLKVIL